MLFLYACLPVCIMYAAKVKRLVFPLMEMLAVLHDDDFTHNDIKPENIMFCFADNDDDLIAPAGSLSDW